MEHENKGRINPKMRKSNDGVSKGGEKSYRRKKRAPSLNNTKKNGAKEGGDDKKGASAGLTLHWGGGSGCGGRKCHQDQSITPLGRV